MAEKVNKITRLPSQTMRLAQEDLDYVFTIGRWTSFSDSARTMVNLVREIESYGLANIMGLIQPNEWKFLSEVVNYKVPTCNKNEVVRQILDPKNLIDKAPLYGVNPKAMAMTISGFDGTQIFALVERINNFYQNPGVSIDDWAKF